MQRIINITEIFRHFSLKNWQYGDKNIFMSTGKVKDQGLCNRYSGAIPNCRFYMFNSSPSLGTLKADYTRYRPIHDLVFSLLWGACIQCKRSSPPPVLLLERAVLVALVKTIPLNTLLTSKPLVCLFRKSYRMRARMQRDILRQKTTDCIKCNERLGMGEGMLY